MRKFPMKMKKLKILYNLQLWKPKKKLQQLSMLPIIQVISAAKDLSILLMLHSVIATNVEPLWN